MLGECKMVSNRHNLIKKLIPDRPPGYARWHVYYAGPHTLRLNNQMPAAKNAYDRTEAVSDRHLALVAIPSGLRVQSPGHLAQMA
jgi:hypothetical protein